MSDRHWPLVAASSAFAVAVPGFAAVGFHLDRSDLGLAFTHGAPFAVFAVIVALLPPKSPRSLRASTAALAAGLIVVISIYAWLLAPGLHGGGGVNFAAAFAYLLLAGLTGGAMHVTFSLLSSARSSPQ